MNTKIQKYKNNFLNERNLTISRLYVSDSENEVMLKKCKKSKNDRIEIESQYKTETDLNGKVRFYTEEAEEVSDEELSQYIAMKTLDKLSKLDEQVYIIKNIMIFWLVLTIIGILASFYMASR